MFVKFIKFIVFLFFNCYNTSNGMSFTRNVDHILTYIMCKFDVSTTVPSIRFFSRKSTLQNVDSLPNLALKATSDVLYDLFLLSKWTFTCI